MIAHEIKNLIFDLGGVIIDLDVSKTHEAFAKLAGISADEIRARASSQAFFNDYEKGLITDDQFREQIRTFLNLPLTDLQIDQAWNAMLLGIPKEKYALLEKLKLSYRVLVLSNTNNIHLKRFNEMVWHDTGRPDLDNFFHLAYYSHLMKMRKPETEIFQFVLRENNFVAAETLFIDDNFENVQSAIAQGIQTKHITSPDMVISLFA